MDINLVKYVINGANVVKIGHFWRKWSKSCHFGAYFGCQHDVICQNLRKEVKKKFTLNVSKNYFSEVYGHKICQNSNNGVNLVKIGHFS